jgi:hypothetical protein
LMWAAYKGYGNCVDILLRWGANVYARDNQGFTALHWALVKGAQHGIFKLVEYGSDRFAENNEGKTPAITAKEMNSVRQWYSALDECGYEKDGSPRNFPLGSVIKDKRALYWKVYFLWPCFNLFWMFWFMSKFPIYIGFPLGVGVGYGLNTLATKALKWAPTDMKKIARTVSLSAFLNTVYVLTFQSHLLAASLLVLSFWWGSTGSFEFYPVSSKQTHVDILALTVFQPHFLPHHS